MIFRNLFSRTQAPENTVILLTDYENEIVFSKIKELFQTCVLYRDSETKTFSELEPFTFNFYSSYRDWETDRKSTRLNSSHSAKSRMPSSA